MTIKVLELFGGIGACSKALERNGVDYEIADYVEIDKYAVKSFNAIHGTNFEPQDITQWDKDIEVDLIMHGSPCQDFSLAGKQAGGDENSGTRSSLMYETIRIVKKLKPKYVIWENVKNLLSQKHRHNFDAYQETMEQLGYRNFYQVLNAKDYGIPQNRERVFTISILNGIEFEFPPKQELKLKLKDVLEDDVDEKFYLSEHITERLVYSKETKRQVVPIKVANSRGYDEATAGDSINIAYPDSKTRRGRVGNQVSQTLQCNDSMAVVVGGVGEKKSNGGTQWYLQNRIYEGDIANTIATCCNPYYKNDLKIRKLTPKECWRLMGFDDADFEKAAKVNSNTQLYKQAGNSIVVNVLQAILGGLLK